MKEYVVGFLINRELNIVLLIEKNKPEWQAGKFNGIGGKIEPGETPLAAMRREFKEEADLDIADWVHKITLEGPDYRVFFFSAFGKFDGFCSMTDEQVLIFPLNRLPVWNMIYNLYWIIPLISDEHIRFPILIPDKTLAIEATGVRR